MIERCYITLSKNVNAFIDEMKSIGDDEVEANDDDKELNENEFEPEIDKDLD